jgi:hypothetical protein
MTQAASNVAQLPLGSPPSIAPLRNVLLLRRALDHLIKRNPNLPGIGVFYGDAGLGKSKACAAAAAALGAVYVEVRSFFTKKAFLVSILTEMGIKPADTIAEMVDQICQQLVLSKKPMILDEGDYLVKRKLIELVRDLYENSGAAILLVGEERFPMALRRESERFYDRVLEWQPAERTDMEDARKLARLYSPDVEIRDDLLAEILKASRGVARRVAVNIENVRQEAKKAAKRVIDAETWGGKPFYTGDAPMRRAPRERAARLQPAPPGRRRAPGAETARHGEQPARRSARRAAEQRHRPRRQGDRRGAARARHEGRREARRHPRARAREVRRA